MNNMPQIFDAALAALNSRDLARAEILLRQVIDGDSSHVAALNLLVIVLMTMERFAEAEPFIKRATDLIKIRRCLSITLGCCGFRQSHFIERSVRRCLCQQREVTDATQALR